MQFAYVSASVAPSFFFADSHPSSNIHVLILTKNLFLEYLFIKNEMAFSDCIFNEDDYYFCKYSGSIVA